MSHAALILNITKPCISCGKIRGNYFYTKCQDCLSNEGPVKEDEDADLA